MLVGPSDSRIYRNRPAELSGGVSLGQKPPVDPAPGPGGGETPVASIPSAKDQTPPEDPATHLWLRSTHHSHHRLLYG